MPTSFCSVGIFCNFAVFFRSMHYFSEKHAIKFLMTLFLLMIHDIFGMTFVILIVTREL